MIKVLNINGIKIAVGILVFISFNLYSFSQNNYLPDLKLKAAKAYDYSKQNNMNTDFTILVDMNIHSGKYRLFLWDFKGDSIRLSAICSHGSCGGKPHPKTAYEQPLFSNKHQSFCSSLGKYKIGNRGYSNWGIHVNYKLHGLESSNDNAYKRIVVLHSWEHVPDQEIYPEYAPNSLGCPMVSNKVMKLLDSVLQDTSVPVMLWIYN
jgi:hypothetical protein